jgi:Holliday junction resolvase-like predicted endonuclease
VGLENVLGSRDTLLYREVRSRDEDRFRGWRNGFVLSVDTTRRVSLLTTAELYASSHERWNGGPTRAKCLQSRFGNSPLRRIRPEEVIGNPVSWEVAAVTRALHASLVSILF